MIRQGPIHPGPEAAVIFVVVVDDLTIRAQATEADHRLAVKEIEVRVIANRPFPSFPVESDGNTEAGFAVGPFLTLVYPADTGFRVSILADDLEVLG
jgi:hypothetical protein